MTRVRLSIELMDHQQEAVGWDRAHAGRHALFWQPGVGKTIAALSICAADPKPTVVVCPLHVMRSAWAADAECIMHSARVHDVVTCIGDVEIVILHGDKRRRAKIMGSIEDMPADRVGRLIIVTNFETLRNMTVLRWFRDSFRVGRFIIDESSKIKNPKSKTSITCVYLAGCADDVILMSGTPAPNGPHEYWPQLMCIDRSTGGLADMPSNRHGLPNFWRWASYWLHPTKRSVLVNDVLKDVITGWSVKSGRADDFHAMIASACWSLRAEDCLDLPRQHSQIIRVQLNTNERSVYRSLEEDLLLRCSENRIKRIEARSLLGKLRQATCGFNYLGGGRVVQHGGSKFAALAELLDSLAGEPVVVWAEHTHEIDAAYTEAVNAGRIPAVLDGRTRYSEQIIREFQEQKVAVDWPEEGEEGDGPIDTLICHPKSVGHGVTLHRAAYAIFLSLGFSHEEHEQARRRIYRKGQNRPVIYYYLLADDTVDHPIMRVLQRKKEQSDIVMQIVSELRSQR